MKHLILGLTTVEVSTTFRARLEPSPQLVIENRTLLPGPRWGTVAEAIPSAYSVLNEGHSSFTRKGDLVNNGSGINYGVEMTLERYFTKTTTSSFLPVVLNRTI